MQTIPVVIALITAIFNAHIHIPIFGSLYFTCVFTLKQVLNVRFYKLLLIKYDSKMVYTNKVS